MLEGSLSRRTRDCKDPKVGQMSSRDGKQNSMARG